MADVEVNGKVYVLRYYNDILTSVICNLMQYYDDITPTDYEPKYFAAARSDVLQFERNVLRVKIGKIETPSHTLNLKFAGVDTSDPNIQLPEETVSLEEMTDYGKQKSTNGTSSSGFGQSLVHHSPGTGDVASASIATSTTVAKKAKDLAEFSDLNIGDNLAKKRHTDWPSDEEPTQVDSECNIAMVERVKSYMYTCFYTSNSFSPSNVSQMFA